MAQGTDKSAPRQEKEARKRTQQSDFARTNAGEQGVDSLRIGREGGLGLAVATGGSAGLLHQSPRACRRLLSLFSFHLQIHGKRAWTRGDLNPCPPPCEGGKIGCQTFLERAKYLQIVVFFHRHISQGFRRFTRVAARLLHIHDQQQKALRLFFRQSHSALG